MTWPPWCSAVTCKHGHHKHCFGFCMVMTLTFFFFNYQTELNKIHLPTVMYFMILQRFDVFESNQQALIFQIFNLMWLLHLVLLKKWVHSAGRSKFKEKIKVLSSQVNSTRPLLRTTTVFLCTLRHDSRLKLCPDPDLSGCRASSGGQKYHASPHKAMFNQKET